MPNFYVNKNTDDDGDHEVHRSSCNWLPKKENRKYLGNYSSCISAVADARKQGYTPANGCAHCSPVCHTS